MKKIILLAAVLVAITGVALARNFTEVYKRDPTTTLYRTDVSVDDPVTIDAPTTSLIINHTNSPTIVVSADFSIVSSTADLVFVRGDLDGTTFVMHGFQVASVTASATLTRGGEFVAPDAFFDTGGSSHHVVLIRNLSGGNVDLLVTKTSDGR